jgi:hypothetical protein
MKSNTPIEREERKAKALEKLKTYQQNTRAFRLTHNRRATRNKVILQVLKAAAKPQ